MQTSHLSNFNGNLVQRGFLVALVLSSGLVACKSSPVPEATAQASPQALSTQAAAPAAEPPKSSVNADAYSVELKAPTGVKVGASSSLRLTVTPKAPFHCNLEYPYKLKLEANSALSLAGDPLAKDAFKIAAEGTTLEVPFTATKPGQHTATGVLSFSVCKDDQCLVERQALAVAITAE